MAYGVEAVSGWKCIEEMSEWGCESEVETCTATVVRCCHGYKVNK